MGAGFRYSERLTAVLLASPDNLVDTGANSVPLTIRRCNETAAVAQKANPAVAIVDLASRLMGRTKQFDGDTKDNLSRFQRLRQ